MVNVTPWKGLFILTGILLLLVLMYFAFRFYSASVLRFIDSGESLSQFRHPKIQDDRHTWLDQKMKDLGITPEIKMQKK